MDGESQPLLGAKQGEKKGLSLWGASFVLANSCIGSGLLSFPYAFSQVGLVLGAVSFLSFAIFLSFSLHVITHSLSVAYARGYSVCGYESLVRIAGGERLAVFMEVTMTMYLFGVGVAYVIIMTDTAVPLIVVFAGANAWISNPAVVAPIMAAGVLLPLALQRHLAAFEHLSAYAVVGVAYMVAVIVAECVSSVPFNHEVDMVILNQDLFTVFPIFAYALGCHLNAALIYHMVDEPSRTPQHFHRCIFFAYGVASLMYLSTGICGYVQFGAKTPQDILDWSAGGAGYPPSNKWAMVARIAILLNSAMCASLNYFPARSMIWSLYTKVSAYSFRHNDAVHTSTSGVAEAGSINWDGGICSGSNGNSQSPIALCTAPMPDPPPPSFRFIVICGVTWVGLCTVLATVCGQLSFVFQLVGSIFGAFEVFFYPALFWWTFGAGFPAKERSRSCWTVLVCAGLAVVGLVMLIMGTATTIEQVLP